VILSVKRLEEQYSRYLRERGARVSPFAREVEEATCITVYTQRLRELAWGVQIEGITMPPQQEQTRLVPWEVIKADDVPRSILITEQAEAALHKPTNRGKYSPYFGSATRLRTKRATLQVLEVGSVVSSIKQLMELHGWVKGNQNMTSLIERLIREKTTLTPEELQKYTKQVYSGSLTHRLPCPALKRGGMANQNLNHSSFHTITSDTALEYAKGGTNYTICFQSVFLYGLSALAHYKEMGVPYPKQMGLHFTCSSCTWVLPPESFEMGDLTYKGVPLNTRIETLHHKDVFERYPLITQVDEETSYAVQMARKFAAWIVNRRMVDKITALDNRAMEENLTLSFVNLAEFSRLLVPLFLKSFIFYCALFDTSFFSNQLDYYNEILEGFTKNPYDVLLDSLRRCGHLRSLISMQSDMYRPSYDNTDLRILLHNIMTRLTEDLKETLSSAYILTHEDTINIVIRAVQVWLQVNELPDYLNTGLNREELDKKIEEHYSQYPSIMPICTLTEEETTHLIRTRKIPENTNK